VDALGYVFLFGCLLVLAAVVLKARDRNLYTKESAPSPPHNSVRDAICDKCHSRNKSHRAMLACKFNYCPECGRKLHP
jgi:late competence protein required for DNA uptake (superfamily II DNA/RNA helicase)